MLKRDHKTIKKNEDISEISTGGNCFTIISKKIWRVHLVLFANIAFVIHSIYNSSINEMFR